MEGAGQSTPTTGCRSQRRPSDVEIDPNKPAVVDGSSIQVPVFSDPGRRSALVLSECVGVHVCSFLHHTDQSIRPMQRGDQGLQREADGRNTKSNESPESPTRGLSSMPSTDMLDSHFLVWRGLSFSGWRLSGWASGKKAHGAVSHTPIRCNYLRATMTGRIVIGSRCEISLQPAPWNKG